MADSRPNAERRSRHAGLSELLWYHEDAKAYLSQNGEWWPVEVGIEFCPGKKKDATVASLGPARGSNLNSETGASLRATAAACLAP